MRGRDRATGQDLGAILNAREWGVDGGPARVAGLGASWQLAKMTSSRQEALLLLLVVNAFGSNSNMPYHLAGYCCGLGQVKEAKQWLGKALLARLTAAPTRMAAGTSTAASSKSPRRIEQGVALDRPSPASPEPACIAMNFQGIVSQWHRRVDPLL